MVVMTRSSRARGLLRKLTVEARPLRVRGRAKARVKAKAKVMDPLKVMPRAAARAAVRLRRKTRSHPPVPPSSTITRSLMKRADICAMRSCTASVRTRIARGLIVKRRRL